MATARALRAPHTPQAPQAPLLSLPGAGTLVDYTLGDLTDTQQRALSGAQMAWLARQASTDPRLALYSKPLTLDDLEAAVVVLRSFFLWGEQSGGGGDPSLRGCFLWLRVLAQQAYDAEYRGHPSPLPLRWMARSELDALEALDAADRDTDEEPPPRPLRPRARRTPRARRETAAAIVTVSSERERVGEGSSDGKGSNHCDTSIHNLPHAAGQQRPTNKGGRRPRRRRVCIAETASAR